MNRLPSSQRGFLLIVAVVLIVIVGLLAAVITFLTTGNVLTSASHATSAQALYLAESGLEFEQRRLAQNLDWYRSSTDPMAPATRSLGAGNFTVYSNLPATMLRRRIPSAVSTADICVYTIDRFPTSGEVQIEDDITSSAEFIHYNGTTSSSAACGNRPALTGITASPTGRDFTIGGVSGAAGPHARNSNVYPVTTLNTPLSNASCTTIPVSFRIVSHPKFLSAGTLNIGGEEISYSGSSISGGLMTLTGVVRCLDGAPAAAHAAGDPVTPVLVGDVSASQEAEMYSNGVVDVTSRAMRKTVQR